MAFVCLFFVVLLVGVNVGRSGTPNLWGGGRGRATPGITDTGVNGNRER